MRRLLPREVVLERPPLAGRRGVLAMAANYIRASGSLDYCLLGLVPIRSESWRHQDRVDIDEPGHGPPPSTPNLLSTRLDVTWITTRALLPAHECPRGRLERLLSTEGESHGLEFEVRRVVAPGLTARAGYAWTRTEITQDALGGAGRELPNAPRHKASAWLRYRFPSNASRAAMVAAGVVHVSDRFTNRDNVVVAPGYTRVDATASWELAGPRLTLGIVAENLANIRYVRSGAGGVFFAGPPRRLALQLTSSLISAP